MRYRNRCRKRDERRDRMQDTNLSGQDDIDSAEFKKHSKQDVFKCAKCEYKTTTIDNLEKHRKVPESMKMCDECEFKPTRGRTLVAHKRTQTDPLSVTNVIIKPREIPHCQP